MIQRIVLRALALPLFLLAPVHAQRPPVQLDSARILHALHGLEVVGSALYIAAHPDDENTRLISYLANGLQVRTAYLSLTRGDGGQNLIGPELGDALGIIRTQELLEARRIDGGEQFFTRAVDFGYSKTAEETFAKWGKQEVLSDVVRVIRTFRPDVIITRFDRDGSGGHGHHTASSILAAEAFDMAADPKAFPEQVAAGLQPWQTKRLYFNGSTWWRRDLAAYAKANPTQWVTVDVGGYDPLLGLSYTELAGRSRSQHKSQGFGAAETRGESLEYLRLDKGVAGPTSDLFSGIETTWARLRGGQRVLEPLRAVIDTFQPQAPELSALKISAVVRVLDELSSSDDLQRDWAMRKASAARDLILQTCGVAIEATCDVSRAAAGTVGEWLKIDYSVLQRRPGKLLSDLVPEPASESWFPARGTLEANHPMLWEDVSTLTAGLLVDQPYWLEAPHDGLYHPIRAGYTGIEPASTSNTSIWKRGLRLSDGLVIPWSRSPMYKWVDRVAGERTRPVVITPIASIRVVEPVAIVRADQTTVSVEIEALADLSGELQIALPDGWSVATSPPTITSLKRGDRRTLDIGLRRTRVASGGKASVSFTGPQGTASRTMHVIDYPHILPQTWYSPAEINLLPLDVTVNAETIGYIDGAGDDVPEALYRLGLNVVRIDPSSARGEDLDKYDAIVTGIRAYNTVAALARFQSTLLAWVERGGTLLVQYNTNGSDLVMSANVIGPYPFSLTRNRVTVEEAPPKFLAPDYPLMNEPNALTAHDFEGWVQERGLYFVGDIDAHYTPLIAWNDPGEQPLNGALIACDHGKGRFIYTGISLFRQLPAGVPGAYRLLANLVSRRAHSEDR
ncbi:MAG: PIG-L family deacetylase [Planctomycetes bacterium]|nr:PIG-L family deacetylase [Planctomycetota bacterium]